ncbi:unnamed protein product, partial [Meganyctiphanes norvegica]
YGNSERNDCVGFRPGEKAYMWDCNDNRYPMICEKNAVYSTKATYSIATTLIISDTGVNATLKSSVDLRCGYEPAIGTDAEDGLCLWRHPNDTYIQVQNIYGNVYSNLSKPTNTTYNQCGIVLSSVSAEDVGNWTCIVPLPGKTLSRTIELNLQNYSGHTYGYTVTSTKTTYSIATTLFISDTGVN